MKNMRPVWGSRSLFLARAGLVAFAALALVVWAVAAPRVVSPGKTPLQKAANGAAPKPLRVSIGSFLAAQSSISRKPVLPKNVSKTYSSGVAAVKTRVVSRVASGENTTISNAALAKPALKARRSVASGGSKTTPTATPAATPTTTTTTSTTPVVTTPTTHTTTTPTTTTPTTTTIRKPTPAPPTITTPIITRPTPPVTKPTPPTKTTPIKTPVWKKGKGT